LETPIIFFLLNLSYGIIPQDTVLYKQRVQRDSRNWPSKTPHGVRAATMVFFGGHDMARINVRRTMVPSLGGLHPQSVKFNRALSAIFSHRLTSAKQAMNAMMDMSHFSLIPAGMGEHHIAAP